MDCETSVRNAQAAAPARAAFAGFIALAAGLSVVHAFRIGASAQGVAWGGTLLCGFAGVLAADFVSGLVHWACDTWGSEHSRWFGSSLIRSFREHHRRPQAMVAHDWIEVNGEAATAAAAFFALMLLGGPAAWLREHPGAYTFAWATISVGALSNQLHQWTHRPAPPRLARILQRAGLILSLRRHAPHHRAPCVNRYCISTGWMNEPLDAIHFWRGLERAIRWSTGAEPRADEPHPTDPAAATLRRLAGE
jgi:ubiquitin-conjugating enzyme E2 variant